MPALSVSAMALCLIVCSTYTVVKEVRAERCLSEIYTIEPGHTACLSKSPHASSLVFVTSASVNVSMRWKMSAGVAKVMKQLIVEQHNSLRASVNATNMQKMAWDNELAAIAQKWADNCQFKHDKKRGIPGRYSVGQNLAFGYTNWAHVIDGWFSEIEYFQYGRQDDMSFREVGHFTQLTWAESAKIGCGWAKCSNLKGRILYACNYATQGNLKWWLPYNTSDGQGKSGSCASCPDTCNEQGLCDCGGRVCENGGTLDVNTCQCSCTKSFHLNDTCQLDCEAAEDNRHCGRFWTVEKCRKYINVPQECPFLCGICPLADYRQRSVKEETTSPPTIVDNSSVQLPLSGTTLCMSLLLCLLQFVGHKQFL